MDWGPQVGFPLICLVRCAFSKNDDIGIRQFSGVTKGCFGQLVLIWYVFYKYCIFPNNCCARQKRLQSVVPLGLGIGLF